MYRNRRLLDLAHGQPCQLQVPGVCCGDWASTVACHANAGRYGKGKGLKAHDWAHAHGCRSCHSWLDQGGAPRAEKEAAFVEAAVRSHAALIELGRVALCDAPLQRCLEDSVASLGEARLPRSADELAELSMLLDAIGEAFMVGTACLRRP